MNNASQQITLSLSANQLRKLKILLELIGENNTQPEITLKEFSEKYLSHIQQNRSKKYLASVITLFNHLFGYFPFPSEKILSDINLQELELFFNELRKTAPKGFVVYFRNLKAAFNKAADWNFIRKNPCDKLKLPKVQKDFPKFLSRDDLEKVLSCAKSELLRDVFLFAFYSGCRLGEIVFLTWQIVNLMDKTIQIGSSEFQTKSKRSRVVPMAEPIYEMLLRRKPKIFSAAGSDLVFSKPDGSIYSGDYFSKGFKKSCLAAGLDPGLHFHSLRHSTASNLVAAGVSIYTVSKVLGHSSVNVTQIYSHLSINELREAVNMLR